MNATHLLRVKLPLTSFTTPLTNLCTASIMRWQAKRGWLEKSKRDAAVVVHSDAACKCSTICHVICYVSIFSSLLSFTVKILLQIIRGGMVRYLLPHPYPIELVPSNLWSLMMMDPIRQESLLRMVLSSALVAIRSTFCLFMMDAPHKMQSLFPHICLELMT